MSRRRVSVKELGVVDCQGWMYRRREGRSLLGSRWRRYWFVLKRSSLYWYPGEMAERAEGFINLCGFTIEQAKQCRRKHAISASHPQVVTLSLAAESFTDMNKWISKLSEAAEPCDLVNTEECYSEGSDQDGDEGPTTVCPLDSQLDTTDSTTGDDLQSSSSTSVPSSTPTTANRSRSNSSGGTLNRSRRRRRKGAEPDSGRRLSWLDLPGEAASVPLLHVSPDGEEDAGIQEKPPDEMESLYNHLKAASLSPIGQTSGRDFRASFIRRCRNDQVNEKLHLLRILSSTLKAKEAELLAVEQILSDTTLTAPSYRKWRESNAPLLQVISERGQAAGGAAELTPESLRGVGLGAGLV